MPKWEHRLLVCCGMAEHNDQHEMTSEEVAALQRKMTSISEPRLIKRILDVNALILLAAVAVLVGLYH
ncbi:hypothetical protein BaRGS_00011716 [Batillaria attramentaria]|uniref:Uncharacterized protein n=1 Tax=Batillaria attramentaria TaxID=370345 RepID=A0ABD0LC88_9CAEN